MRAGNRNLACHEELAEPSSCDRTWHPRFAALDHPHVAEAQTQVHHAFRGARRPPGVE